jgi:hypothetical protein
MTIVSRKVLLGLAGFALLAIPAGAAARDRRETRYQPAPTHVIGRPAQPPARTLRAAVVRPPSFVAPHRARPVFAPPIAFNPPRESGPRPMQVAPSRAQPGSPRLNPMPPVRVVRPVPPPARWANTDFDDDQALPPFNRRSYRERDRDDYPPVVCDEDGDDCRPVAQYRCDEDGDACGRYGQEDLRYERYSQPYSGVPSYYNGRSDLLAQRQRIIARLDYAQAQFHAARASGDRKLSARWATYIKNLNHSLAAFDARAARAAYGAYNHPGYAAAPPPISPYPYSGYPSAGYSGGYPNAAAYGASPYGTSPLGGIMSSLVGPMLGSGQIP